MKSNVNMIYDLIQKDLKAEGWNDISIAEAIAECQRERQSTDADDSTICVKEMSYLSQESFQKIAEQMDNKKAKDNIFVRIKNWLFNLAKRFWQLNWEAKIGILFLIPPIIGVIFFILNLMDAHLGFESFPESWNCISGYDSDSGSWGEGSYGWAYGYAATPAIPLYMGLMAIAGAYLLKGNLPKKNK